jgi:hypothetical protein
MMSVNKLWNRIILQMLFSCGMIADAPLPYNAGYQFEELIYAFSSNFQT